LALIERADQNRRTDCRFVFHDDGSPVGDFRKSWATACDSAGLGGIIVHDLRRTAVRNLVRAGIPEIVAMRLTGHKTRRIFDHYNIVSTKDLEKAPALLDQYLAAQPTTPTVTNIAQAAESRAARRGRKNTPTAENSDRSRTISDHPETEVAVSA
jgi:hypothetical protein